MGTSHFPVEEGHRSIPESGELYSVALLVHGEVPEIIIFHVLVYHSISFNNTFTCIGVLMEGSYVDLSL